MSNNLIPSNDSVSLNDCGLKTMMNLRHCMVQVAILFMLACVSTTSAYAQAVTVTTVFLRNPPPADLGSWRTDPNIAQIIIGSTQILNEDVFIGIEIVRNNQRVAYSKLDGTLRPYRIPFPSQLVINQQEIQRSAQFDIDSALRLQAATTNMLPEGRYDYCVTVYRRNQTGQLVPIVNTNQQQRSCTSFTIQIPEMIQLRLPPNTQRLPVGNAPVTFTWTPLNTGTLVKYRIVVAAMFDGQQEQQVLSDVFSRPSPVRTDFILLDDIITTPTTIPQMFYPAILNRINRMPCVNRIAWQVQALDMMNRPIAVRGASDGRSEIWTFLFNEQQANCSSTAQCNDGTMRLDSYYPAQHDTIPWLTPPLIVRWGEFCNTMVGFTYDVTVQNESGTLPGNNRRLAWGGRENSIYAAQGLSQSDPRANERARLLIANWLNDAGNADVAMNSRFRRGEEYTWTVRGTLTRGTNERNQVFPVSATSRFSLGLKMPLQPFPADGATLDTSQLRCDQSLLFTIPPPAQLMYPDADIVSLERRSGGTIQFPAANEKIRIVISRNADLASPMF
ncbi:MAG: hypothetical protein JNL32_11300, partial [Candidatus Kapabacteria bacterium]|nr:hypothetical protein [Candidatus Kapabacteria bacterium]